MRIDHFYKVDIAGITADFSGDDKHRVSLTIPLLDRDTNNTLCIIGQNPSNANELHADKTLHFLERFVYERMPLYSKIVMLNLYTRVDTPKEFKSDLLRLACERKVRRILKENTDFLLVFGKLKNQGKYKFPKKFSYVKQHLIGKSNYIIDVDGISGYAPHPGNKEIYYGNYSYFPSPVNIEEL
ncbi:DUF1643 domain-containing protein [Photobacterium marinum]|uniref:DUF1643 domain-containing protein n=1 Tax=Photobacterium marinum TaxID=1056511 RepID=UPI000565D6AE|nr:DUF1643 domain-containing protein [Photobacterium marinum]